MYDFLSSDDKSKTCRGVTTEPRKRKKNDDEGILLLRGRNARDRGGPCRPAHLPLQRLVSEQLAFPRGRCGADSTSYSSTPLSLSLHPSLTLASSKWGSLNLAVLYPRDNVKVTGDLDAFSKPKDGKPNEGCIRKTCAKCHCNVLVDHREFSVASRPPPLRPPRRQLS